MPYEFQAYPKMLYHRKNAPNGKVFNSAVETAELENEGWVDSPSKFTKLTIREEYVEASEEYAFWTKGNCSPQSNKWEEVTARYKVAKDNYDFSIREEELRGKHPNKEKSKSKWPQTFVTAFGKFTVTGPPLGQGGAGTVFPVSDEDGQPWAIKQLHERSSKKLKRFKNEIAFCRRDIHSNIVQIVDWGTSEIEGAQLPFYVMHQFASTMRIQIKDGILRKDILRYFEQILAGVESAHANKVWHRDLKPENILYNPVLQQIVIADFGIAHFTEELLHTAIETRGERIANFEYAAPEQRRPGTKVDHRADIYALGLILNEMFSGRVIQGTGHATIGEIAPEFEYLDKLVDRMVQQSPDNRPQSIGEIREHLHSRSPLAGPLIDTALDTRALSEPNIAPDSNSKKKRNTTAQVLRQLEIEIYNNADNRNAHLDLGQLSAQHDISTRYLLEFLEHLHREGTISMSKWDGTKDLPFDNWPTSSGFFNHTADGGYIRTTLKLKGKQRLEEYKRQDSSQVS